MSNWNYWKELPYRGEPPDNAPKNKRPKRNRSRRDILRDNIVGLLKLLIICGFIFLMSYLAADRSLERAFGPALFLIAIVLLPFTLSAGIKTWNKYLRGDDLEEPNDENEKREE